MLPLPSEGGHAPLAFVSEEEFAFLAFLKKRTAFSHAFGDIVVSGPGLSALHEFLTGRRLDPAEVAGDIGPHSETTRWFARFFGRACRSYALHVLAWSQGVAVMASAFRDEDFIRREVAGIEQWLDGLPETLSPA